LFPGLKTGVSTRKTMTVRLNALGDRNAESGARAAALVLLALPGSAYLYQGEELGLPEVTDIGDDAREDPRFFRTKGESPGRDGCRVPLPWARPAPVSVFPERRTVLPPRPPGCPSRPGGVPAAWSPSGRISTRS
jgi:glycosidase